MTDLFGNIDEEMMYQAALRVPLAEKIEMAIRWIREFESQALELSHFGYAVANSGGKDSACIMALFEMAGVKFKSFYNNVTIDPPEVIYHLKKHYPQTIWNNPKRSLFAEIPHHAPGLPTRTGRWCCQLYKEQGNQGLFKSVGVRAPESARRKGLWRTVTRFKSDLSPVLSQVLSPVLYWTDEDVWQFIRDNKIPYCSLYDEGFKRLGCVGCPLGGKNRVREFERWPRYEAMWKRAGRLWWEKYRIKEKPDGSAYFAAKFPTFEAYWSWWMEDKNVNDSDTPDCQLWLW